MAGHLLYGEPPTELADRPAGAVQVSPLIPGAGDLADIAPAFLDGALMLAPPGTIERRFALALTLRALTPGAPLTVMAPKDKGGSRLAKELAAFGCEVATDGRRHYRICMTRRPPAPTGLEDAIAEGAPRLVEALGLWSQPGVFSWDRIDPGSALLAKHLPPLAGAGADLGCGVGFLSLEILKSQAVTGLTLIDIDGRAIDSAQRNVADSRADIVWADAARHGLAGLDFVVMNPPFHDAGQEDRTLGQAFIRAAARALRPGGVCWLVANRHLPYEAVMGPLFTKVTLKAETGGFKVYEARK